MHQTEKYIKPFLEYLESEKRYSPHTIIAYGSGIERFLYFIKKKKKGIEFQNISYKDVRAWLAFLKEGNENENQNDDENENQNESPNDDENDNKEKKQKKNTARSINRKISSLKTFFKFHIAAGNIEHNPMNKIFSSKTKKHLPVFIKESDIAHLSNILDIATENWKSLNASILVSLFYATGMRLSELVYLKDIDIDFSRRQIKVLGKGNKERYIPITLQTIEKIKNYQQLKYKEFGSEQPELLLTEKGKKLYPKYAYLLVKKYLAVIPTLDKKSPHVLRHSFATHLMNSGAEINAVKELLGHSSLAATQVYTHNTIEKLKEVYKKAHPKS